MNFQQEVMSLIPENGPVCFFCDDDILYRPPPRGLVWPHLLAFSLRLGLNTTHCYPHGRDQLMPAALSVKADRIVWDWFGQDGDFGYPFSLDGHVLWPGVVRALAEKEEWSNPNQLEDALMRSASGIYGHGLTRMGSPKDSCLVGVPANQVSATHGSNRAMDAPAYMPEALNEMFLDGWRINWRAMDYSGVNAAHCELTYVFEREVA
jgi:hypothetical protein